MLEFITAHGSIIISILTMIINPAIGFGIRMYIKLHDQSKAIVRINKDMADYRKCNDDEHHELRETSSVTSKEILARLDKITDKMVTIGEDVAFLKGLNKNN
jgi:hypothetical protein